jgi:uncharacterized repeat protein (TIGR02543 family)
MISLASRRGVFQPLCALVLLVALLLSLLPAHAADWVQGFGSTGATARVQVTAVDTTGNTYVAGYFSGGSTLVLGSVTLTKIGTQDAFAAKLDSAGTVVWAKNFGGSGVSAQGVGIAVDSSGNVHLGGNFYGGSLTTPALTWRGGSSYNNDDFVIKLDSDGNLIWAKNFGDSGVAIGGSASGAAIAVDGSGNVYLGGYFYNTNLPSLSLTKLGNRDALVIKLDSSGNLAWAKNFGGSGALAMAMGVAVDGSGNVFVGGNFQNADLSSPPLGKIGSSDAFVFKLDSSGALVWAKNFGSSIGASTYGNGIAVDGSGNVYLGGYFNGSSLTTPSLAITTGSSRDALVIKLGSDGTLAWAKNFGGSGAMTEAGGVAVDTAGNVYVGGYFQNSGLAAPALSLTGSRDAFAIRLNSAGAVTGAANYGGSGALVQGQSVAVDGAGKVHLGGLFQSADLTTPALARVGTQDAFVLQDDLPPFYGVAYDGNGAGSGAVPTDAAAYAPGATVTVKSNSGNLTKSGNAFAGWNTAADGSGTSYVAGSGSFAISANTTLYAKWTAATTYSVTYDGNGAGSGTAPTDAAAYTAGATATAKSNSGNLAKTGYTFAGWNRAADGSGTSYAAGSGSFAINADTTLYAKWTALPTYSVTYDGNGAGSGTVPTDATAYLGGATVTVMDNSGSLTKSGNAFAGWNTAADGSGTNYVAGSGSFAIGANTTLYATWTAATTYSVTYDGNGASTGTVPTDAAAYLGGATATAAANSGNLTKTGYTFDGWNTAADGSGTSYVAGSDSFAVSADTTIYAKWTAVPVPVNGACGGSHGQSFGSAPSANLCSVGTAGAVSGSGPWSWACAGSGGGTNASCSASLAIPQQDDTPAPTPIVTQQPGATLTTIDVGGTHVPVVGNGTITVTSTASNQVLMATTQPGGGTSTPPAIVVTARQAGATATGSGDAASSNAPTIQLTGSTTVTVQSGANVLGTVLSLAPTSGGSTVPTTTVVIGGQPLTLTASGGAQLAFSTVTTDGSAVPVLALTGGSASLTASAAGQPLVAMGGAAATAGCADSNVVMRYDDTGRLTEATVTQCYIVLPASAFTSSLSPSSTTSRMPRALSGNRLYAGEQVLWDTNGLVTQARLGSPGSDAGWVGDPLTPAALAGLVVQPGSPRLDGHSTRLGDDIATVFNRAIQTRYALAVEGDTDAYGAFRLGNGTDSYQVAPVGRITVDTARADGTSQPGNGDIALTAQGITVTYTSASTDLAALTRFVSGLGIALTQQADGTLLATVGEERFALQPGYCIEPNAGVEGIGQDADGHVVYTDPHGWRQVYYPVAADFATLVAELRKLDAQSTVRGNADGTLSVRFTGQDFVLTPGYALTAVPAAHAGDPWWFGADGLLYLHIPGLGLAQGFAVR